MWGYFVGAKGNKQVDGGGMFVALFRVAMEDVTTALHSGAKSGR